MAIVQPVANSLLNTLPLNSKGVILLGSSHDNVVAQVDNSIYRWSLNKSIDDVRTEAAFIQYLYENDVKVAKVLKVIETTVSGQPYPCLLTEYIPHLASASPSNLIPQAATELHRIHSFGQRYCARKPYRQDRSLSELLERLDSQLETGMSPNAINRLQVRSDIQWALDFIRNQANSKIPRTIIHNDFRPQNILAGERELVAVIDFDYAISTHSPQKDVAHSALEWSFPDKNDKPNWKHFEQFVATYAALSDQSYDSYTRETRLFNWVKVSALIDAAGYWLRSPQSTTERFGSYMYKKFLYFKEYHDV